MDLHRISKAAGEQKVPREEHQILEMFRLESFVTLLVKIVMLLVKNSYVADSR